MALTKEEWFQKLKSWVPGWFLDSPHYQQATFYALAQMLSNAQASSEYCTNQSFISRADEGFLELIGSERGVTRFSGEALEFYREKVRNFTNTTNIPAIKALIDSVLADGQSLFIEDYSAPNFLNRQTLFCNRGQLLIDNILDTFTVIVENQIDSDDKTALFTALSSMISQSKAFGTLYRLYERTS